MTEDVATSVPVVKRSVVDDLARFNSLSGLPVHPDLGIRKLVIWLATDRPRRDRGDHDGVRVGDVIDVECGDSTIDHQAAVEMPEVVIGLPKIPGRDLTFIKPVP